MDFKKLIEELAKSNYKIDVTWLIEISQKFDSSITNIIITGDKYYYRDIFDNSSLRDLVIDVDVYDSKFSENANPLASHTKLFAYILCTLPFTMLEIYDILEQRSYMYNAIIVYLKINKNLTDDVKLWLQFQMEDIE